MVVDKTILGLNMGKLALIFIDRGRKICKTIEETGQRGSTLIQAFGGWKGDGRHTVVSACRTKQMSEVLAAVKKTVPMAFAMVSDSGEM